ncbi:MAG: lactate utilization protein [Spirochaetota bacterium]
MTELEMWYYEARAERVRDALKKNDFEAVFVKTKEEAAAYVLGFVSPGMKVGFGGSMTSKALGLADKAGEKGAEVLDHNKPGLGQEEKLGILRAQLTCDLFVSGLNAITQEGYIVNVDANGNRVGAMCFGPKKVIAVAGANKIVCDLEEAFVRLEDIAGPLNNKRLARPNPCTKTGQCMDCESPMRSCRIYQILKRKPALSDFTVVLVGEQLGF